MQSFTDVSRVFISFSQWCGCITGLTGAALIAVQLSYSRWGFIFFLVSNVCFFLYGYLIRARGLYISQIGLSVTSVLGVSNYFFDGLGNRFATSLLIAIDSWSAFR